MTIDRDTCANDATKLGFNKSQLPRIDLALLHFAAELTELIQSCSGSRVLGGQDDGTGLFWIRDLDLDPQRIVGHDPLNPVRPLDQRPGGIVFKQLIDTELKKLVFIGHTIGIEMMQGDRTVMRLK